MAEKENQDNAAEALILLGESTIQLHVDNETQTCQAETTEVATQTSSLQTTPTSTHPTTPVICYVPVESGARSAASTFTSEMLKESDDGIRFYTELSSWRVFQQLVSFLSACCPSLRTKFSPSDSTLLTLIQLRLNL